MSFVISFKGQLVNPPVFLFVIDTCLSEEELTALKNALIMALSLMPENALIGLITFGKTVSEFKISFRM